MFGFRKIPFQENTDEQLMSLVCTGNEKAFELLYDRYFNKLVWFAKSYISNTHKAEDAVQEVFMKIIQQPRSFDTGKKFSTWIYSLTGNTCKNILRNEKNRSELLEQELKNHTFVTPENHSDFDFRLLNEQIRQVYLSLNEKEKNVYILRFEQELSIRETASILNIPEGSVKSCIYYLLKKMSKELKEFNYEK